MTKTIRENNMTDDKELKAIKEILDALEPLGFQAQQYVLNYCQARAGNWELRNPAQGLPGATQLGYNATALGQATLSSHETSTSVGSPGGSEAPLSTQSKDSEEK